LFSLSSSRFICCCLHSRLQKATSPLHDATKKITKISEWWLVVGDQFDHLISNLFDSARNTDLQSVGIIGGRSPLNIPWMMRRLLQRAICTAGSKGNSLLFFGIFLLSQKWILFSLKTGQKCRKQLILTIAVSTSYLHLVSEPSNMPKIGCDKIKSLSISTNKTGRATRSYKDMDHTEKKQTINPPQSKRSLNWYSDQEKLLYKKKVPSLRRRTAKRLREI
jgi:hypothetical protein